MRVRAGLLLRDSFRFLPRPSARKKVFAGFSVLVGFWEGGIVVSVQLILKGRVFRRGDLAVAIPVDEVEDLLKAGVSDAPGINRRPLRLRVVAMLR